MGTNGITITKKHLDKIIEEKFPKKKGIRKSKFYDSKEDCWFLVREIDRKNLYQVYAIKVENEEIKLYRFFDSKVANFTPDEVFNLQSTREKVKDLVRQCKVGWRECPVEIFPKPNLK